MTSPLFAEIVVRVPNTQEARSVLRRLADHAYDRGRSAASHAEGDAWRRVAAEIQIALEPEQLAADEAGA